MESPAPQVDYVLKQTSPHLGDRRVRGGGWLRREHNMSTYSLVQQRQYVYVRIVKAKNLPVKDMSSHCDPYAVVRLGNYKSTTKHLGKQTNPEWNVVYAFEKERIQSSEVEIIVRDTDDMKDEVIGTVSIDLNGVPFRVPPDSSLAPQWYRLRNQRSDYEMMGEIMLSVWIGTQADEAFPEAWSTEAVSVESKDLINIRSKVYLSPILWYVRVNVIEARDLHPLGRENYFEVLCKVQLQNQMIKTKFAKPVSSDSWWNEDLVFVAAEPFEEHLVLSVEGRLGSSKHEVLGKSIIPLGSVPARLDHRTVTSKWYNLEKPDLGDRHGGRIHLRVCLDGGYHVLDESTHYISDLRPSAKQLWKPSVGVLEVGVLSAHGLRPMKTKDGGATTDAYCVAKYGRKWIRTRTIMNSFSPQWNEQYTWEVYDPCTVITVGIFDNCHLQSDTSDQEASGVKDAKIGKVRIRLSTLETDRVYTHLYPLLVLQPSGVEKTGELQLAVRFTCFSLVNMMHIYTTPQLPKMHYIHPLSVGQVEELKNQARNIVAMILSRAEPPIRKEVVEYMIDFDSNMWSMRRSKAYFSRIMSVLSVFISLFGEICQWKNPLITVLVHIMFFILVWYPRLILPSFFMCMFLVGIRNFWSRPRHPPYMDIKLSCIETVHPDELDEEFDTFPTSKDSDSVMIRYDKIRSLAGRVQTVAGDVALHGERIWALLNWRDPRATTIFLTFCLSAANVLYAIPFQIIAVAAGFYILRHPCFRHKLPSTPSAPLNLFARLPTRTDCML